MKDITENFEIITALIDYRHEDWVVLQGEAEKISIWVPDLVQIFYDTLYSYGKTKSVFHEGERPKVEKTLAAWIMSLASGDRELEFWEHQWVIALLHIKRKVRNIYVLGMMNRLQQLFLTKCTEVYEPKKALQVYGALLRVTGLTAALIAECYTELQDSITEEGLCMAGLNPGLIRRIRDRQIEKMMANVQRQHPVN